MDPPSPRSARYYYYLSTPYQQQQQPLRNPIMPPDFKFEVSVTLLYSFSSPNSHPRVMNTSFETSIILCYKRVFHHHDHQDFLRTYLPNSYSSLLTYFSPQCLDRLSNKIVPQIQQMLHHYHSIAKPLHQAFRLDLDMVIDVPIIEDVEIEALSMEEDVKMVPASDEAIQSLKTYKFPEQCQICMEKFHGEGDDDDDDDVEITPLPCDHVFHHKCIVQWLQTSHMCPMCRYPLSRKE